MGLVAGLPDLEAVMETPADCRKRAQECLDLIPKMSREARPILLSIAEAWLVLAHELDGDVEPRPMRRAHSSDVH